MKTHALAAILVTICLAVASASAQNTSAGPNAQANAAQTQPPQAHPQVAVQTPPANGSTASATVSAPQDTNAQVTPPSGKNAEIGIATINPTGIPPSQRNPLLADNGDVRISKLIGSTIYNKDDQKVGSVDDVLAGTGSCKS